MKHGMVVGDDLVSHSESEIMKARKVINTGIICKMIKQKVLPICTASSMFNILHFVKIECQLANRLYKEYHMVTICILTRYVNYKTTMSRKMCLAVINAGISCLKSRNGGR